MTPRNIRRIDLAALKNNVTRIKQSLPSGVMMLAVVKADGYGHGAVEVSRIALANGADMLAVATTGEGRILRDAGIRAPILILGANAENESREAIRAGLIQTVFTPDMIRQCEQDAKAMHTEAEVHLKIDSGMGRIGIRTAEERDGILETLAACPHVRLAGVYTHFSDADGDEEGIRYTEEQFRRFTGLIEPLPPGIVRHCCNSAALDRFPGMALDIVRAGISLYGYPPVPDSIGLSPCMTWTARVSHIKELSAGDCVSYGRTYTCPGPVRVATVTCGYGDGYFRSAGREGYVLIRGKRAKILGRVCMDQMMADVSDIEDAAVGDEAVLIGRSGNERITAKDMASWCGTISYEILLHYSDRVERSYLSDPVSEKTEEQTSV